MIKPILFNTAMVQAILDGRKAMTRRVCVPLTLNYPKGAYAEETPEQWLKRWNYKPKYHAGDILWVRETWCKLFGLYHYRSDTLTGNDEQFHQAITDAKWRPSIFMPREACRLFLRVTDVRAERLQEITEDDARAEGCITFCEKIGDGKFNDVLEFDLTATDAFKELWDNLNAKRGYGWETNPWVWVYTFERCEKPEGWPNK